MFYNFDQIINYNILLYIEITMNKWTGHDYWVDSKSIDAALKGVKVGLAISDYYSLIYKVYIQYLRIFTLKIM